jgi:cytochrome c oxidase subunit II
MRRTTTLYLLLAVILALGLAACGGDGSDDTITPTPTASQPLTGAALGEQLFTETYGCTGCHALQAGDTAGRPGPPLIGMARTAATRVDDLSAEGYLRQSVLDPWAYIVPGYEDASPMPVYDYLNEQEVAALVAYMLTLDG